MCSLDTYFDEEVPTAATNGLVIKIGPQFFMNLPEPQRVFLLAHETMHVVYQHMLRRGLRDPQKFNIAADYVINLELVNQGLTMIPGGMIDPKYKDLSTEEVYDLLPDDLPDNPMDGDLEEGDAEGDPNYDEDKIKNEIEQMVSRAVQLTDMRGESGSVPGSVRRMLIEISKPKVNWRVVVRRFLTALDKSDYSWSRPNRRYQDVYLPHVKSTTALTKISFAVDVSCSVTDRQFDQFISEIHSVFKMMKPRELEVMQFDHILQSVDVVKTARELLGIPFLGKGGTSPEVAIDHFIKHSRSKALIVITDGEFYTERLSKPKQPVIWVIFNNPRWQAPYGKTVHIAIDR